MEEHIIGRFECFSSMEPSSVGGGSNTNIPCQEKNLVVGLSLSLFLKLKYLI